MTQVFNFCWCQIRYCEEPYEPFNASNVAQYVIGEDYLPAWKVPALQKYSELSYGFKESFDAYLRSISIIASLPSNKILI
jgi:hypothetical protein